LYVGKIQARKNITRLLRSFEYLKEKRKIEHKLVLVGNGMWESSDLAKAEDRVHDDVIMAGYVNFTDLPFLYNGADCFVYPSLFEGFGIPPLESMACGVPTVISNTTSLPEIGGDASVYVDPLDVSSIAGGIEQLLDDSRLHAELGQRGRVRASGFSWDRTAQKTLEVFEELAP
jgi:glycosyltransferase involved in cell wall biosynthesis